MRVNYNASAFMSASCLRKNENALNSSLERLSSGLKINHSKDNPSGLAIAKRMNLQIKGVKKASTNSSEGISIIQTADGALNEVHSILQRINELCVQASNGIESDADRKAVQNEVEQLKKEIDRVASNTDFNGQTLLDGQFELKGYTDTYGVKVRNYSDAVKSGIYECNIKCTSVTPREYSVTLASKGFGADSALYEKSYDADKGVLTITGPESFVMEIGIDDDEFRNVGDNKTVKMDITGIGSMNIQIGANEGQMLHMRIPRADIEAIGIKDIDLSTEEGANEALSIMGKAIDYVSEVRGRLGAYENRLEHTKSSLDVTEENMTSAYSGIMDLDMAEEMTQFTSMQVLTQAGTTMVAQANQRPEQILQLLQ